MIYFNPQLATYPDPGIKPQRFQDTVVKPERDKGANDKIKGLKDTCKEFESIFVYYMLKAMRNTVLKSDLLHRDVSEDIYNSMFDQEITRNISDGKGIGISSMIFQQLKVSNGFVDIIKEGQTDEDNGKDKTITR